MAVPNLWRLCQFDQKRNGVCGRLEDGPLMKQITVEAMPCVITYVGIVRRNGAQQPRNIGCSAIGMAQLVPPHLVEPFEHGFAPVVSITQCRSPAPQSCGKPSSRGLYQYSPAAHGTYTRMLDDEEAAKGRRRDSLARMSLISSKAPRAPE